MMKMKMKLKIKLKIEMEIVMEIDLKIKRMIVKKIKSSNLVARYLKTSHKIIIKNMNSECLF